MNKKKEQFLNLIETAVMDLFYYKRKDDIELSAEDIDELIKSNNLTKKEILDRFEKELYLIKGIK